MSTTYMSDGDVKRIKGMMVTAGFNVMSLAPIMGWGEATAYRKMNGKADWSKTEMKRFGEIVGQEPARIFFAS